MITGASGSMGSAATKMLAAKGFKIIMACRNLSKAASVRDIILHDVPEAELELAELRLDSFASIRDFASSLDGRALYGLFNNAGVMPKDYSLTEDGFEQTIAVNYLGPFLLHATMSRNHLILSMSGQMVTGSCTTMLSQSWL